MNVPLPSGPLGVVAIFGIAAAVAAFFWLMHVIVDQLFPPPKRDNDTQLLIDDPALHVLLMGWRIGSFSYAHVLTLARRSARSDASLALFEKIIGSEHRNEGP